MLCVCVRVCVLCGENKLLLLEPPRLCIINGVLLFSTVATGKLFNPTTVLHTIASLHSSSLYIKRARKLNFYCTGCCFVFTGK